MKPDFTQMEEEITKNFRHIYSILFNSHKTGRTAISRAMGYSSTAQLESTLRGEALISTKAVIGMVKNLNVNPTYLFTGKGEIFLTDESGVDNLLSVNAELGKKYDEAVKTINALNDTIRKLEKRNNDLIDLSSAALKYHKEHKEESTEDDSSLSSK